MKILSILTALKQIQYDIGLNRTKDEPTPSFKYHCMLLKHLIAVYQTYTPQMFFEM